MTTDVEVLTTYIESVLPGVDSETGRLLLAFTPEVCQASMGKPLPIIFDRPLELWLIPCRSLDHSPTCTLIRSTQLGLGFQDDGTPRLFAVSLPLWSLSDSNPLAEAAATAKALNVPENNAYIARNVQSPIGEGQTRYVIAIPLSLYELQKIPVIVPGETGTTPSIIYNRDVRTARLLADVLTRTLGITPQLTKQIANYNVTVHVTQSGIDLPTLHGLISDSVRRVVKEIHPIAGADEASLRRTIALRALSLIPLPGIEKVIAAIELAQSLTEFARHRR